jgi:hypothetical protein
MNDYMAGLLFALSKEDVGLVRRRQIAAVNLMVTLRAIGVERGLQGGTRANVSQQPRVIGADWAGAMSRMASQAEERRRLMQQVVRYRTVRIVTNSAILRNRRVLVRKGALLLRMAPVTHHVDRRFP